MDKLRITNDYIFKTIFGKKGNEGILKDLLISILDIPIKEIEILHDVHLERDIEENKEGILDIRATLNNNIIVNIEMQVRNKHNMIDRSLYYWSKLYTQSLSKRQDYIESNKTIAINILDYNIFKEGPYHEKCMITRKYNNEVLTNDLEIHFIQIPKCEKEKIKTTLDFWIRFISNIKDEEVEKMKEEISEETLNAVMEAHEEYMRIMSDPQIRREVERREMAEYDRISEKMYAKKEGMEEGMRKGEKNKAIEIARKMKEEKINIETIIRTTGLTIEEIEKI